MLLSLLFFLVFMAPVFAVAEQRAADRKAARLIEEVRAELASGAPVREAPPERRLLMWPYAVLGIALSSLWALANAGSSPSGGGGGLIGMGVFAAVLVWLPFHIFIFVKRSSTGVSLLTLVVMIAAAAGLAYATQFSPALADIARRLG